MFTLLALIVLAVIKEALKLPVIEPLVILAKLELNGPIVKLLLVILTELPEMFNLVSPDPITISTPDPGAALIAPSLSNIKLALAVPSPI